MSPQPDRRQHKVVKPPRKDTTCCHNTHGAHKEGSHCKQMPAGTSAPPLRRHAHVWPRPVPECLVCMRTADDRYGGGVQLDFVGYSPGGIVYTLEVNKLQPSWCAAAAAGTPRAHAAKQHACMDPGLLSRPNVFSFPHPHGPPMDECTMRLPLPRPPVTLPAARPARGRCRSSSACRCRAASQSSPAGRRT